MPLPHSRGVLTRSAALITIAGFPLALAACSSTPHHPKSSATTSTTSKSGSSKSHTSSTSGQTGTTTATTAAGSTTNPTYATHPTSVTLAKGAVAPPVCTASILKASEGTQGINGTNVTANITFTNTSAKTCSLSGYPTITLSGSNGVTQPSQVIQGGVAGVVAPVSVVTVVLAANGGQASFGASWYPLNNEPSCDFTTVWHLGVPGVSGTINDPIQAPVCDNGVIHVTPLQANFVDLKG